MDSKKAYCRLCASAKQSRKLIDLKTDKEKLIIVVKQLTRLNVTMDFDFDNFPNTVCLQCLEELEQTSRFVKDIEQAQITLCNILVEVKTESVTDPTVHISESNSVNYVGTEIKVEFIPDLVKNNESNEFKTLKTDESNVSVSADTSNPFGSSSIKVYEDGPIFESENNDNSCVTTYNSGTTSAVKKTPTKKMPVKKAKKKNDKKSNSSVRAFIPQPPLSSWADYHWNCSCCEAQFSTLDEVKTHSLKNHFCCNAYRCTDCGQQNFIQDLFLKHIRLHHHTSLRFSCHKCNKNFKTHQRLYKHDCIMDRDKDKQYYCRGCTMRFDTVSELEVHIDKYLIKPKPSQKGKYLCNICQKYFKTEAIFNSHKEKHYKKFEEMICDHCGKKYTIKGRLASHMLQHIENRPFSCDICNQRFKLAIRLRRHIHDVHSSQEQLYCEECGKIFKCKNYLAAHKKTHEVIQSGIKKYACKYCDKKFLRKPGLKVHIRQHTGDRPYCCQYCGKTFVSSANYYKHLKRKHHLEKKSKE